MVLVIKSMALLVRKVSQKFESTKNEVNLLKDHSEINVLLKISEQGLRLVKLLLPCVQVEFPVYSIEGYYEIVKEMEEILMILKGMVASTPHFLDKDSLSRKFRISVGTVTAKLAKQLSSSLLELLDYAKIDVSQVKEVYEEYSSVFLEQRKKFFHSGQKVDFQSKESLSELQATYFFAFQITNLALRINSHQNKPLYVFSLYPFWEGFSFSYFLIFFI